jgi:hypothetical protein
VSGCTICCVPGVLRLRIKRPYSELIARHVAKREAPDFLCEAPGRVLMQEHSSRRPPATVPEDISFSEPASGREMNEATIARAARS